MILLEIPQPPPLFSLLRQLFRWKNQKPPNLQTPATVAAIDLTTVPVQNVVSSPSHGEDTQKLSRPAPLWKDLVKGTSVKLEQKETPFTLDSGEACVKIPNSVIKKNKKAWDNFILGQFYEEPPPRGAVHAIVNGIWSRQRRDISVSKLDGHVFLFRVACPSARRCILSQSLWQIDGQTMFVAKWSPGVQQEKPELSMIPVWLEFKDIPLQFFNGEGLQEIAGMVG